MAEKDIKKANKKIKELDKKIEKLEKELGEQLDQAYLLDYIMEENGVILLFYLPIIFYLFI